MTDNSRLEISSLEKMKFQVFYTKSYEISFSLRDQREKISSGAAWYNKRDTEQNDGSSSFYSLFVCSGGTIGNKTQVKQRNKHIFPDLFSLAKI